MGDRPAFSYSETVILLLSFDLRVYGRPSHNAEVILRDLLLSKTKSGGLSTTVQDYRSGFLRRDSPPRAKNV
jgi:hypothetical protein